MLKRTFKYTDYNGVPREETVYFNLTEAEITEISLSVSGGLDQMIRRIVEAQDGKQILSTFKEILLKSYGEKSPDGKRFIKSKELSEAFSQTEMYNELFMELAFDAEKASEFITAVCPKQKDNKGKIVDIPAVSNEPTVEAVFSVDNA